MHYFSLVIGCNVLVGADHTQLATEAAMRKFRPPIQNRSTARLAADGSGAATVEAVLWMPVFIALFALLADTALLFGARAQTQRVAQDANRALSVGRFMSTADTGDLVRARLIRFSLGGRAAP